MLFGKIKKIEEKMNWFNAKSYDELMDEDVTDKTCLECFWIGFKEGFKQALPYLMVLYSIIGYWACIKAKGVVGVYKKLK